MKKNWPILVIVLVVVIIVMFVILRKQLKRASGNLGTNNGTSGGSQNSGMPTYYGKIAYADRDKVNVYTSQLTLYKTAKQDEWIGTVDSERNVSIPGKYNPDTNQWESPMSFDAYVLKGDRLVDKNDVYLQ